MHFNRNVTYEKNYYINDTGKIKHYTIPVYRKCSPFELTICLIFNILYMYLYVFCFYYKKPIIDPLANIKSPFLTLQFIGILLSIILTLLNILLCKNTQKLIKLLRINALIFITFTLYVLLYKINLNKLYEQNSILAYNLFNAQSYLNISVQLLIIIYMIHKSFSLSSMERRKKEVSKHDDILFGTNLSSAKSGKDTDKNGKI
ncbi:MAG: hypothetical protein IJV31_03525 [Clostridia bacterium]|nr:hypothetical protein [Clostridia bacterium]